MYLQLSAPKKMAVEALPFKCVPSDVVNVSALIVSIEVPASVVRMAHVTGAFIRVAVSPDTERTAPHPSDA
jgi:hypothetical protein